METGDLLAPSSADASVRPARAGDAAAIGAVQARAWRTSYADLLPEQVLEALTADRLEAAWHAAVTEPPTPRHAVLVACSGTAVVGFAAFGPSQDPDAEDGDGELATFAVDPAHRRTGHGSRLLAATAAGLRDRQLSAVRIWVPALDDPLRGFLTQAGLITDGARRTYRGRGGAQVVELRFAADLADPE